VWNVFFGLAMCVYGAWLATTTSGVGFGIEGDAPWFLLKRPTKRVLGVLVTAGGLLLMLSALLGEPLL
jgi:hypothetical protein